MGGRPGSPGTPGSATAPAARSRRVERISESGLFDREYYELQRGITFASDRSAVRDYLQFGRRAGLAPNVLFEPEWYRPGVWRGKREPLLAYLRGEGGVRDPSPVFDQNGYLARFPEAAEHPGRALGHFLASAAEGDELPVPAELIGSRLTLGEVRAAVHGCAREFRRMDELRVAPRRGRWDPESDDTFVKTWLATRVDGVFDTSGPNSDQGDGKHTPVAPMTTIVMPVRNRPAQVLEAIASVQAQTLTDWELVVVDDGSTDATAAIVEREAALDTRIRLTRISPSGVGAARNAGVAAARGRWLAFLDSDNTWVPHFLQVMVSYLQSSQVQAGYSVINAIPGAKADVEFSHLFFDGGLEHLLVENHIDLNSLVVDATLVRAVGGFDTELRRWGDHDFAIRLARQTSVQLVPFVGVHYDHASDATDRITNTESGHWRWVALGKNYVNWDSLAEDAAERVPGRVSICMPTYQDWRLTAAAVRCVLADADKEASAGGRAGEVEVVIAENGSRRAVAALLRAMFLNDARVRIRLLPRNLNFAIGSNVAFAESTGETVVFLNNDTEVLPGWLAPLLDALDDETVLGCQPLLLYPNGTIQTAGTAFLGGDHLPSPLLVGHPMDDARRAAPIRLHAVSAAALAMRAKDVIELRGFDPMFVNGFEDVDLCLRAVDGGSRRFAVVPESVVLHHEGRTPGRSACQQANREIWMERWRGRLPEGELGILQRLGFEVAHVHPGDRVGQPGDIRMPRPVLVRPPAQVARGEMRGYPRLRWALKTSVPVREVLGEAFDLVSANELACALRRLGQDVVVDPWEGNQRATSHFDDVVVAVRGETPLVEEPGRVNILWPIASADGVSPLEARRYDVVVVTTDAGPMMFPGAEWKPTVTPSPVRATVGPWPLLREEDLDALARLMLFTTIEGHSAAARLRAAVPM